ncbi:MAG TPA: SDR family NAD(P)-dependent oxidoreductase, partial [Acidimicrobiales bacterium]|nr:SDR family NAD(P)-dependent oxidoreductase [Acidimicrobiales bacterium]
MGALGGKVAVVTGGASGIGLASCRRLVAEGATVVVVDANGGGAEKAASELGGVAVQADVGNVADWHRILDAAQKLGGIDIAYLNAGVTTGEEDIVKVTDEQ